MTDSLSHNDSYVSEYLSDQALAWIVRLNSGEATDEDLTAYRRWKAASPLHEAAAQEAETLWSWADNVDRNPESGLIQPLQRHPRVSRRALLRGLVGLPVLGLSGHLAWRRLERGFADFVTGTAETSVAGLQDGSRVVFNAWSRANQSYGEALRGLALLEGQAFFDMQPDPTRPFEVSAAGLQVTGDTAAFDLDHSLPRGALAVSVTRGEVWLHRGGLTPVVLEAGFRAVIGDDGQIAAPEPQEASVTLAWQEGRLVAENRRLDEVIAALRPWYPGWIILRSETLAGLRVTAVLDLADPVGSLQTLAQGLPISVQGTADFYQYISEA